ncbi:MAG: sigma-70 family RNA polymerase sigma factor [Acidobacteriota bacterium]
MGTTGLVATLHSSARSPVVESASRRDALVADLFDAHAAGLYRLAVAMLREPHEAHDVVQDTFIRLIAHVAAGGPLPNARGWLYTVAAHACRDRQRRLQRWLPWIAERDRRLSGDDADAHDGPAVVIAAVRALPPRDRLLVALRAQGLSYQDIAAAARIRPGSVGRLLARALDRLAAHLDGTA